MLIPSADDIAQTGSPSHLIFFSRHDKHARLATLREGRCCRALVLLLEVSEASVEIGADDGCGEEEDDIRDLFIFGGVV